MLYPILTPSRSLTDLSGIWDFKLDDGSGFEKKWFAAPLQDSIPMPVPSSYNDLKEGKAFRDHYGWVFYQKVISVPPCMMTQRIMLRCEAVTHHAQVYLNGELLVSNDCGFLPFETELTDKIKPGQNLLTIAVSNIIDYTTLPVGGMGELDMGQGVTEEEPTELQNYPNFDFFNYSGIIRPVKLYTTPKSYIADVVFTPDVIGKNAELAYTVETVGQGECKIELRDKNGTVVASANGASGILHVENVNLWEPGNPYLYQAVITFGEDEYTLPYGIRTVKVDGTRFLINGKPFYFKGYGKHEDTFPHGRGLNLPMNVKDIGLMKWQGANSMRTSHYPYSEEMMRLCDEEGIVVIDETTAVGISLTWDTGAVFEGKHISTFDKEHGIQTQVHHRQVIRELIARDKNYACVVMWCIANEPDAYSEGSLEYFSPLFHLAKELDTQKRPCTLTLAHEPGSDDPDKNCAKDICDVICLNRYYSWYNQVGKIEKGANALRKELEQWSTVKKPVMFTEYGADTISGLHDIASVMYTEEYQAEFYQAHSAVFDSFDFFIGEQVWNFADFATSQSLYRVQGNRKGLFTRDRRPKMAAYYLRERWKKIPNFNYKQGE